jgi:hypothetical protein
MILNQNFLRRGRSLYWKCFLICSADISSIVLVVERQIVKTKKTQGDSSLEIIYHDQTYHDHVLALKFVIPVHMLIYFLQFWKLNNRLVTI